MWSMTMKRLLISMIAVGLAVPGVALAQSAAPNNSGNTQAAAPSNTASQRSLANAQKIKQDLQNAGFTDVNVVAESFVVQAKTKDGDPVVMTIGPHGMTVFETVNAGKSGPNTTGSTNASGSSASGSSGSHK
jgi:hypothetical protein